MFALKDITGHPVPETLWLEDRVNRSQQSVFSEVITLTPEKARVLLGDGVNESNRKIVQTWVDTLATDMELGMWELNGEAIIISSDGKLCDGQHRCAAVIKSDTPITTVITFGVDYKSRLTTNVNRVKGVADFLSMEQQVTNATAAAAAAKIVLAADTGVPLTGPRAASLTKAAIRGHYNKYKKQIDNAVSFMTSDGTARVLGGPSTLAAILVLLRRISPSADDFMAKAIKGNDLADGDAILALRDRLMRDPRMPIQTRVALFEKAFDSWMQGREVRRLHVSQRLANERKSLFAVKKPGRQS